MTRGAIALTLVALTATAGAEPPRLPPTIRIARVPTTLAMRFGPEALLPQPTTVAPPPAPRRPRRRRPVVARPDPAPPRFTAQLSMGMAVDGAALRNLTGAASPTGTTVGGADYVEGQTFRGARAYAFGDAYLGSRGLVVPGISAYLASQFRLRPDALYKAPFVDGWDEIDPVQLRAAWTEADGVIDSGPLRTLRLRGGRQFVYGPAIAHLDGLQATWSSRWLKLGAYLGSRVPDWDTGDARTEPRQLITGAEATLTLRPGPRPLAVRLRSLRYAGASHGDATVDWSPRTDVALAFTTRFADREVARQRATARIRVSDETRLVLELDLRQRADWLWDYELRDDEPGRTRRYLDLGPSLPRTTVRARAGTVLLDNIDTLVFGGLAFDRKDAATEDSLTSAGWAEGGGAVEIRVRRTVAVTLSGLARIYSRVDATGEEIIDTEDVVQPLGGDSRSIGERNLIEGGAQVRFTGGARRFSASAEIYARRTRYAVLYVDDQVASPFTEALEPLDDTTVHGGGRFLFEAWVSPRLRMRAEYELTNRFASAPEIAGLKALRLVAEGHY